MQKYIDFERGLRADLVSIMRHLNRPAHMRHDLHRFCNLTDVAMTVSACRLLASTLRGFTVPCSAAGCSAVQQESGNAYASSMLCSRCLR